MTSAATAVAAADDADGATAFTATAADDDDVATSLSHQCAVMR